MHLFVHTLCKTRSDSLSDSRRHQGLWVLGIHDFPDMEHAFI